MSYVARCDLCGKAADSEETRFFEVVLYRHHAAVAYDRVDRSNNIFINGVDLCPDCMQKALSVELLSKLREDAEEWELDGEREG